MAIECRSLYEVLLQNGIGFYCGVPDSLLKSFCAYVADHVDDADHVITANEGAAIALATGYHLATERLGLVYMQNSGQGNAVNPLTSLADPEVYSIPMLLMIGWRGEPGVKDEPQHVKQGRVTLDLLETLEIPHAVLPDDIAAARATVEHAVETATADSAPYALVVRKGTFAGYKLRDTEEHDYPLVREEAIAMVIESLGDRDIVVSTTGKPSREVYEYREARGDGHGHDFLTVGCMGHASQIALGIAQQKPGRRVYCLDGDGSSIMHMGSMAVIGSRACENLKHVVFNNGAHDSVGGQPTVGFEIDLAAIATACGYKAAWCANEADGIRRHLVDLRESAGPALLEIRVRKGARGDLGRPRTGPLQNKRDFMSFVAEQMGQHGPSEEHVGAGAIAVLGDVLERRGAASVFLVAGRGSFEASGADAATREALGGRDVTRFRLSETGTEMAELETSLPLFRNRSPDVVVAVGGGSVLDMAKLTAACAAQDRDPAEYVVRGRPLDRDPVPIVAVPTTAGSGSEATHFAVVYVDGNKHSLADERLRPQVVILDPELTSSLPPAATAHCGMDVLCQAIESHWSVNSTDESRHLGERAMRLAMANLTGAVNAPSAESRQAMLTAANLAGKAIDVAKTTACHALSYRLTSDWGVPHGHAVSLSLGAMCVFNARVTPEDVIDPRGVEHVLRVMGEILDVLGAPSAEAARASIADLMGAVGLGVRLRDVGIERDEDLDRIVDSVNVERLANNPRAMSRAALLEIMRSVR